MSDDEVGLSWRHCFLCSSPVTTAAGGGDYGVGGESQKEMVDNSVKLLMKYLLHDFKLEGPLAASVIAQWSGGGGGGKGNDGADGDDDDGDRGGTLGGGGDFSPKLCAYCKNLVGSISKLQLELEVIQMKMVSGLETVKRAVISNSRLYGGNDGVKQRFEELEEKMLEVETGGGDCHCTSGRRFLDAIHHFQTFVFENDSKTQHIPLVYLERLTGKKISVPLSTSLNLESTGPNNIKDEPEDYYEPMLMEDGADLNFELPVPPPPEQVVKTTTRRRRRGRKSAQLASARLSQTLIKKAAKAPKEKEPKKKESQAMLLLRQIRREKNYAKKWQGPGRSKPKKNDQTNKRTFTCDECGLSVKNPTSSALEQHLKEHEASSQKPKNYECPDCKTPFSQKQYFELHLSYHAQVQRKCDICALHVPLAELKAHLESHQEKIFGCAYCSMWTPTFEALARHLRCHVGVSVRCELCPAEEDSTTTTTYQVRADLPRHLSEVHGRARKEFKCSFDGCSEVVFYNHTSLVNHLNVHNRVHTCSTCGKSLGSSANLERHIRSQHPDPAANVTDGRFPCDADACEETFLTERHLRRHQVEVHNRPKLKCDQCPKEFIFEKERRVHAKFVHNVKVGRALTTYTCRHCGKMMLNKTFWIQHEAGHTREKNFTCEICGFATHAKEWLRRHKEIHDERRERKFQCPHCSDRFYESDSLVNHIRRHTGERPHQCDECGATFTQKSALNTHSKRHEDGKKEFVPPPSQRTRPTPNGKKNKNATISTSGESSLAQNWGEQESRMDLVGPAGQGCQLPADAPTTTPPRADTGLF